MTIHDELVRELIKLADWGKPTGYIINIVGSANIKYVLEELFYCSEERKTPVSVGFQLVEMTPDIVVTVIDSGKRTAIEVENDINWDFADSLRQVRKYRRNYKDFDDVVVIIPKRYERFARLYKKEGFQVYLWKATRIWECMRCGNEMEDERTVKPKCSSKDCSSTEQTLKGLKEESKDIFEPFEYPIKS